MPAGFLSSQYFSPGASNPNRKGPLGEILSTPFSFKSGDGFGSAGSPDSIEGNYKLYNSAVEQNATDYGDIMGAYKNLLTDLQTKSPLITSSGTYNPKTYEYNPTANAAGAINNLKNLSESGGYQPGELADLRERGISPIRAAYAGANRDIDRNRALRGGYSPGYQAVKAKMAREQSSLLADQMTKVNAGIAENVAQNRLAVAPQYAAAAGAESALKNQYASKNTDILNEAQRFNLDRPFEIAKFNSGIAGGQQSIIDAMRSLYGTTPALANLFGNQAQSAAKLQYQTNPYGTLTRDQMTPANGYFGFGG